MDLVFLAEALTQVPLPGQLVVLALMIGCGLWTALRAGALPVIALAACAALWLRADSQLEGFVLITFSPGHGLVLADLLVPALGCVVLLSRGDRPARGRRPDSSHRQQNGRADRKRVRTT
jgi:hypothetical protein